MVVKEAKFGFDKEDVEDVAFPDTGEDGKASEGLEFIRKRHGRLLSEDIKESLINQGVD